MSLESRLAQVVQRIAWEMKALRTQQWVWSRLAADAVVSTTAYSATALTFTAAANTTYVVELIGSCRTAATTTGMAVALAVPAGATVVGSVLQHSTATAVVGLQQIASGTTTGVSAGVATANTDTPVLGKWLVRVGGGGAVTLLLRSEVAGSAVTLPAGLCALGYLAV